MPLSPAPFETQRSGESNKLGRALRVAGIALGALRTTSIDVAHFASNTIGNAASRLNDHEYGNRDDS